MKLHMPPALRHRRFRLLWIGLLISVAGSRMQFVALLWHIKQLSDLPIYLGLVGLARIVPIVAFSLLGGAIADTLDRRKILYVTQSVQIGVALILSILTYTDQILMWHLYALTAVQAAALSFDLPARQSLTPNLVPSADLPNAFSMQSIAFTTGSIIGPALTGFILATPSLGQPFTYFFNAISYLAIIAAVILMGPVAQDRDISTGSGNRLEAIKEGITFIVNQPIILSSMLLDFVATFFSSANALMPIFAQDILHVGEIGFGWLSAAQAMGAATMAAILSQLREIRTQGKLILISVVIYGAATIMFGFSTNFWIAMLALVIVGSADALSTIIRNTIRQMQTPDRLRGRMTSVNQIFFMGGPQLGEIEAGTVATLFGTPFAVVSGGFLCIVGVGWISKRWPQLRNYDGAI
ncbi:MAG: MFS transporter [Chloroflexota bacterium]